MGFPNLEADLVTKDGFNKRPQLGPAGNRIVFVSSMRDKHRQFQGYLIDLESGKERRLTYQDGDVYDVHIDRKGTGLFYSSTTDEIKEDSDYIRRALNPSAAEEAKAQKESLSDDLMAALPRAEVYQSTLNGYKIVRLTERPGFDGMIAVHPKKDRIAYTRWNGKGPSILALELGNSKNSAKLLKTGGYNPRYSPNGKQLAWLQQTKGEYKIVVADENANGQKVSVSGEAQIVDFSWAPDGKSILYSRLIGSEGRNSEIYRVILKDSCVQRVTYHASRELSPQLSPDGKTLYFESDRLQMSQIFKMNLEKLPPCTQDS